MRYLNHILETIVIGWLGPRVAKLPKGWKTVAGLCLLVLAQVCLAFVEGRTIDAGTLHWIEWGVDKAEWIGWVLFGVGVYHKAYAAQPRA